MGRWTTIAIAVTACAIGCGADEPMHGPPLQSSAPIVGDWFLCDAADCSTLKNHGVNWATDGRWALLLVKDAQALTPTGTYCSSPYDANQGPFTFDEATGSLVMMDDLGRDAGGGTLTFAGTTASLAQMNGITSLYMKIDPPRTSGQCPLP